MLRLLGVFVVASLLSSGSIRTYAQKTPDAENQPLITPPKLIRFVEAPHPEADDEEPTEAVVELDIVVGRDGLVTEVSVARSAGEGFDEAALAAARQFVFEPARKDWEPIAARIRYRYVFELKAAPEEMMPAKI